MIATRRNTEKSFVIRKVKVKFMTRSALEDRHTVSVGRTFVAMITGE